MEKKEESEMDEKIKKKKRRRGGRGGRRISRMEWEGDGGIAGGKNGSKYGGEKEIKRSEVEKKWMKRRKIYQGGREQKQERKLEKVERRKMNQEEDKERKNGGK